MTIWLEFPPARLTAIRAAYLDTRVRGADNPDEDEKIQESPQTDATGARMLIGSSRLDVATADTLSLGHSPWLIVHTEFPPDWQYPDGEP